MADHWDRRTTLIAHAGLVDAPVLAAIEKTALGLGIDWDPATATLVWDTTGTTTAGRLRKRTRTVRTVGLLTPDVLAWTIDQDGDGPHAMVVRRSRVDVADGVTALAGLSPEVAARFASADTDGVTVRGDLGGRDLGDVFIGLGSGPDADTVKAALLARV